MRTRNSLALGLILTAAIAALGCDHLRPKDTRADVTVAPENVSKPPASVMPSSERYKQ
jgi:hypothetical protein